MPALRRRHRARDPEVLAVAQARQGRIVAARLRTQVSVRSIEYNPRDEKTARGSSCSCFAGAGARRSFRSRSPARARSASRSRSRRSPAKARWRRAFPPSCAPTWNAAACSARSRCRRSTRRRPSPRSVNYAEWRSRRPMRWCSARSRRGPTAASTCASSCSTSVKGADLSGVAYTLSREPGARHRAPHRRLHLREADRREGRVLDPHRLRGEARQPLQAADRRRRRRGRGDRARPRRADHLAGLVARRPAPRLRVVRDQEAGGLRALAAPTASARWWPTSAARTARRPGRPTAQRWRSRCRATAARSSSSSTRTAATCAASRSSGGIDTEPVFSPDGQSIYFTSDRGGSPQIYRMPAGGGDAAARHLRGQLQHLAAHQPGRQGARLHHAQQRQVPGRDARSSPRARPQMLTDSDKDESPSFAPNGRMLLLATVDRRARRAVRGVGRRPHQAAADAYRRATCANRRGGRSSK